MTRRHRCKSCRGTYALESADGTSYYHACPPFSEPEWDALPEPMKKIFPPGSDRPNKRDENVALDSSGRSRGMKSEGDGVDEI